MTTILTTMVPMTDPDTVRKSYGDEMKCLRPMSSSVFGVANSEDLGPVTREIFYFIFYTKLHALYFKI